MEKSLRKQLKENMKDTRPVVGLVSVKNMHNQKVYIESSINANALINRIRFTLNGGRFENNMLQQDWNEIGGEHFSFDIISEIKYDEANALNYRKEVLKLKGIALENLRLSGLESYHEFDI